MSKPDRAPTSVWCLRRDDLNTYVQTDRDDTINIVIGAGTSSCAAYYGLSRADARLLAKRINQCLDDTARWH